MKLIIPTRSNQQDNCLIEKTLQRDNRGSRSILFVSDLFQPVHGFTVLSFLYGYVCHRRSECCTVRVLFVGSKPDYVTRAEFFSESSPALRESAAQFSPLSPLVNRAAGSTPQ